jgi:hypothetical protein
MKELLTALILIAALESPAHADGHFMDGYTLRQLCQGIELADHPADWGELLQSARDGMKCLAYVEGVLDGVSTHLAPMCVPNMRIGQALILVRNYLETHPQYLHRSAADLVVLTLGEAFPCGRR